MLILKFLLKILTAILSIPLLYLAVALAFSHITTEDVPDCEPGRSILLSTNGVHVDMIFAVDELNTELKKGLVINPGDKYLSFGWGDREFYLNTPEWSDLTFKTAFQAAFLKGEALMHVTRYNRLQDDWVEVDLCPSQFNAIMKYINSSFKLEQGDKVLLQNAGYTDIDDFYEAKGSYSLFFTSNTWANKGLKRAGLKTPVWTPFDFAILRNFEDPGN